MFIVYVLYSKNHHKTYVGFTTDLEKRFHAHNVAGRKGWTIAFRPWIIIHTEIYNNKDEAMKREKALKTGKNREFIKKIVLEII